MKRNQIITVVVLLFTLNSYAQKNYYKDGEIAFYSEKYTTAIDYYKRAEVKEKTGKLKGEINFKIALCYAQLLDINQAEVYLSRAETLKYKSEEPQLIYEMAEVLMQQGEYKKAAKYFESYLSIVPENSLAKTKLISCQKYEQLSESDDLYTFQSEIQLNTEYYDYATAIGDKKADHLLFASTRPGNMGTGLDERTGQSYSDIWITSRDAKGKWSEPQILPNTINTEHNEGTPILNKKSDEMYFTRCQVVKNKNIGCDIYHSEKKGNQWTEATLINFKPDGADSLSVGHPAIDPKEDILVFSSDLPGGYGGKDLWYAIFNKKEKQWQTPINLGPKINTPGNEVFPYFYEDRLYFSSDGHYGLGGLDLYFSTIDEQLNCSIPEHLPTPLNSSRDDFGITLETENRGFLTSNRKGGKGMDDIYSFNLQPIHIDVECYVTDYVTKKPIPFALIELTSSNNEVYTVRADENGFFKFDHLSKDNPPIMENNNYQFLARSENYSPAISKISTYDIETSKKYVEEFILYPIDQVIDLPEVRYDFNDTALQVITNVVNSEDSLNVLFDNMINNPGWVVELQAHTDCRGPEPYNLKLSQGRANACVAYLISKGINPARLVPVGYGENTPIEGLECNSIEKLATEELKEEAHQRNRRTQFKILSTDFK